MRNISTPRPVSVTFIVKINKIVTNQKDGPGFQHKWSNLLRCRHSPITCGIQRQWTVFYYTFLFCQNLPHSAANGLRSQTQPPYWTLRLLWDLFLPGCWFIQKPYLDVATGSWQQWRQNVRSQTIPVSFTNFALCFHQVNVTVSSKSFIFFIIHFHRCF